MRALARAAGYGAWRAEPRGHVPAFADIRTADARALVREFLRQAPGWLPPEQAAELLRCYGIPLADLPPAGTEVTVRVAADRMFGSLVTFGEGPRTARLTPLTDLDADKLIRFASRLPPEADLGGAARPAAPGLAARRGPARSHRPRPRSGRRRAGLAVVNARVKVTPYEPQDPFLRKLR